MSAKPQPAQIRISCSTGDLSIRRQFFERFRAFPSAGTAGDRQSLEWLNFHESFELKVRNSPEIVQIHELEIQCPSISFEACVCNQWAATRKLICSKIVVVLRAANHFQERSALFFILRNVRFRNLLDEFLDDVVCCHSFRLSLEIGGDSMP